MAGSILPVFADEWSRSEKVVTMNRICSMQGKTGI
jgi:hypothetical protein